MMDRANIFKLINYYEINPILWDPSHKNYSNRFKRCNTINMIASKMKMNG